MTRRQLLASGLMASLGGCATAAIDNAEARYPPVGRFVEVEGLRVHWTETGEGPPVVLLHGASGNLRDMSFSLMDRLAERGLRAVAFDRPGLGYTQRPAERGWDPAVQARVLRGAAREIGIGPALIVGHSWGGAAALAWALDEPESATGVVSLAGATMPWGGDAGLLYTLGAMDVVGPAVARAAAAFATRDRIESTVAGIFEPNEPPPGYVDYIGAALALRPETFQANAEDLDHLNAALKAQAERYDGLVPPVLALHGDADDTVWASVHSEPLAERAPRGRVELLPGIGHMLHHAAEDRVVDAIASMAADDAA